MSWTTFVCTYLNMLMSKIKATTNEYDLQSMIAPLLWCFDTYPVLSIVLLIVASAYAVPIFVFLLFGVITFVITFAGFLFLEGAIIAIAFVVLLSVLSTLTITLAFFILTCWTIYLVIAQFCQAVPVASFSNVPPNDNLVDNNNHLNRSFHVNEE